MESLQEMMSAVMARQAAEDGLDTFAKDIRRMSNLISFYQEPGSDNPLQVVAAELFLKFMSELPEDEGTED